MEDIKIEILNHNNEAEIVEYERGMYKAFSRNDANGWAMTNYELIDGDRLRSKKLPLDDQVFFVVRRAGGGIEIGAAMNFNHINQFQAEDMGFTLDKDERTCEGLILFSDPDSERGDFVELAAGLFEYIIEHIKERGIEVVYCTCSRKIKAMYTLLGFEVADRIVVNDEKKLLMRMEI